MRTITIDCIKKFRKIGCRGNKSRVDPRTPTCQGTNCATPGSRSWPGPPPLKIMAATKMHAPFPLPPLRPIKVPSIPLPRAVLRVGHRRVVGSSHRVLHNRSQFVLMGHGTSRYPPSRRNPHQRPGMGARRPHLARRAAQGTGSRCARRDDRRADRTASRAGSEPACAAAMRGIVI